MAAAPLYFTSSAGHAGNRLEYATSTSIAAGAPATVPLMPSRAMSSVPLMPRAAKGGERRAQPLGRRPGKSGRARRL